MTQKNMPMTSGCCVNGGVYSLVSGHAYTLLDVKDVIDDGGKNHTLAKLRNPWAQEMYTGPWRDDDPNWTAKMKAQVNLTVANDGAFWMEYDTYFNYFFSSSVALYAAYNDYHLMDITLRKRNVIYKIDNPVAQELFITAETYSRRHYPRSGSCNPKNSVGMYLID